MRITLISIITIIFLLPDSANAQIAQKDSEVIVIAHRGGIVPGYPENTLLAFQRCIDIGVDFIELDLRATKDGEIVIIHDETLDRTTNGSGDVSEFTLKELRKLDAGKGERIPTLDEVLRLISNTDVMLLFDVKLNRNLNADRILKSVERHKMKSNVIYGIRSLKDLSKFHEIDSEIITLGFISKQDQIDDFIENGIDIIRLKQQWIEDDSGFVASMHKKGVPTWTTLSLMSDDDLLALIDTGINGIIYDDPGQLQKNLSKKED